MPLGGSDRGFNDWYDLVKTLNRLSDDPYDLRHHYDYEAAYKAGAKVGPGGHLPSQFKSLSHPQRFIGGVDTATGRAAKPGDMARSVHLRLLIEALYKGKEGE